MDKILVTGGAGFVGSNLSIRFKETYPQAKVIAFDNLKRRGSELNLQRFKSAGVQFVHGDVRVPSDFSEAGAVDLIIDCAAEPSVMAGTNSGPNYLIDTNFTGTINTLEHARACKAALLFLSTSRIYPMAPIEALPFEEKTTRFELTGNTANGISENFPIDGARSLYGASKLAAEHFVHEYIAGYGLQSVINRCGVLTGPWQMGKTDQGVIVLWAAHHFFNKPLKFIGYGGTGKQVRDILHVDDLFDLLQIQLGNLSKYSGQVFNVGGGREVSVSLRELTSVCQELSGNTVEIEQVAETRQNDLRIYLSDCTKVMNATGWKPKNGVHEIMKDIFTWLKANQESLRPILIG